MNITINKSIRPFSITFQRRIWMQIILDISRSHHKYKDSLLEGIELIRLIQVQLIVTEGEGYDQLITVDINKLQFGILNVVSDGYAISSADKYSKTFDECIDFIHHAYKQMA